MNNKVFLVMLEGGGDRYIKIVDEETFNWICSDDEGRPEGKEDALCWPDQCVPESQLQKMRTLFDSDEDFHLPDVTTGSLDNDRAIHAQPADGYDEYDTIKEAMAAIKENGDKLEDEYEGYMY